MAAITIEKPVEIDREQNLKDHRLYWIDRRTQDVILSALALVVLSPVMLATAIAIVVDDPSAGPVFSQERIGRNGKPFKFYKFRSMCPNAEAKLDDLLDQNEMDGGYETFVYKLTEHHQNKKNIKYHVACKANGDGCMDETKFDGVTKINDHEFELHNAHCFKIDVPQIGPAQAIYYDVAALKACCEHIKKNHIPHPIVYIMACRIGPFAGHFYQEIHKLGGTVYLNPDGECEIIWATREKPDFMRVYAA